MTTPSLTARALAFLRRFRSAPALARECRRRRVRGEPAKVTDCPLANLLAEEFGEKFTVVPLHAGLSMKAYFRAKWEREELLPPAANQFALAVDSGRYPDLVRGSGS
jgi:hypothetical protein